MRGDAPKGQGGVRIKINYILPPASLRSSTPLINEGGKAAIICVVINCGLCYDKQGDFYGKE